MSDDKSKQKELFLKKEGLLNPKPDRIIHPLFNTHDFFNPLDLPQVRYEMLRCARAREQSVSGACKAFGFSREYFYRLERNFMRQGYSALLGSQVGRRPLILLNQEIVSFIVLEKIRNSKITAGNLLKQIQKRYNVECSIRTVERVIEKVGAGKKWGAYGDHENRIS